MAQMWAGASPVSVQMWEGRSSLRSAAAELAWACTAPSLAIRRIPPALAISRKHPLPGNPQVCIVAPDVRKGIRNHIVDILLSEARSPLRMAPKGHAHPESSRNALRIFEIRARVFEKTSPLALVPGPLPHTPHAARAAPRGSEMGVYFEKKGGSRCMPFNAYRPSRSPVASAPT